jgi:hypothetical protein
VADFIFDSQGRAQGFRLGSYLYTLSGKAVGRVIAERAFDLDGRYVGAVYRNMVVDKPGYIPRDLGPVAYPGDVVPPQRPDFRNSPGHDYQDMFPRLLAPLNGVAPRNGAGSAPKFEIEDDPDDDFFA